MTVALDCYPNMTLNRTTVPCAQFNAEVEMSMFSSIQELERRRSAGQAAISTAASRAGIDPNPHHGAAGPVVRLAGGNNLGHEWRPGDGDDSPYDHTSYVSDD